MSIQFKDVKVNEVLSEVQYYVVEKIVGDKMQLKTDGGESIVVDKPYVENLLISGEQYSNEVKVTQTEVANIFLQNPNVALTVNFNKQVKEADVVKEVIEAHGNSTPKEFETKVKKAVKKALNGEERILVGRHSGSVDEFGRVHIIDMKIAKDPSKQYDVRQRLVDPRTISYVIVKNTKYVVK